MVVKHVTFVTKMTQLGTWFLNIDHFACFIWLIFYMATGLSKRVFEWTKLNFSQCFGCQIEGLNMN
jgi:hypothetical protein